MSEEGKVQIRLVFELPDKDTAEQFQGKCSEYQLLEETVWVALEKDNKFFVGFLVMEKE